MNSLVLGAASVYDIQLLSRDPFSSPEKPGPELLIPVTNIDMKAGRVRQDTQVVGEPVWIPAGRKATFLNATSEPIRFVEVLFKAESKN